MNPGKDVPRKKRLENRMVSDRFYFFRKAEKSGNVSGVLAVYISEARNRNQQTSTFACRF